MRRKRLLAAAALVASAAMLLAGCAKGGSTDSSSSSNSSGWNGAIDKVLNASAKTGGTLKLITTADCDSWDPARTYYGWCWNQQRLFTRTLVGYSNVGSSPKLGADLATDTGKHNADYTEWTYTLKDGVKWSNGKEITAADVKYGIERMFATDVINGGPTSYFLDSLDMPKNYAGPYKDGEAKQGITVSGNTIKFKLKASNSDFPYMLALPAASPVPNKTEGGEGYTGANYQKKPMSSGPFEISSYSKNKEVVFTRNKYWSQSTDTIRKPKVNKITLTVDTNANDVDQKLQAGSVDALANGDIGTTLQTKILTDSKFKANADNPEAASTAYLSVMPSVIPNLHCRKAVFYATNKAAVQQALGGNIRGAIAGSMTPVTIPGHSSTANMYPSGKDNTGDLTKAKAELKSCGKPTGFSTKFAYSTADPRYAKVFAAMQTALARVGIKLSGAPNDGSTYYSTFIGSPQNIKNQGLGIANAGWGADFPSGYGFWNSIANGNAIMATGNTNYPSLNDSAVNDLLAEALVGKGTDANIRKLDDKVMANAVYLPLVFRKDIYYRNARLTNVTSNMALAFGIYDFVNVGVSDGK